MDHEPEDREQLLREVRRERRQELVEQLAVVVEGSAAYGEELQRDDGAHKARLQKRRDRLEESIRRARELMHDWPITEEDIVRYQVERRLIERARASRGPT